MNLAVMLLSWCPSLYSSVSLWILETDILLIHIDPNVVYIFIIDIDAQC